MTGYISERKRKTNKQTVLRTLSIAEYIKTAKFSRVQEPFIIVKRTYVRLHRMDKF